jgi:hypothetical protein
MSSKYIGINFPILASVMENKNYIFQLQMGINFGMKNNYTQEHQNISESTPEEKSIQLKHTKIHHNQLYDSRINTSFYYGGKNSKLHLHVITN